MARVMEGCDTGIGERVRLAISDVLGVSGDNFDSESSFLELGFDSLSLAKVAARLSETFKVDVLAPDIFAYPCVSALSAFLAAHGGEAPQSGAVREALSIGSAEINTSVPLSFAQERLWFLVQLEQGASRAYHVPVALRLSGRVDRGALRRALDRIVARHESLRTRFVRVDGAAVQRISAEGIGFVLREQDLRGCSASQLQEVLEEEARARFDLSEGPLVRGRLIVLGDEEHVLLITMHHIVTDGWSMGVFFRELGTLYAAFSQGRADLLEPLSTQYTNYAQWQRSWLQGERLLQQGRYWQEALKGAPALLELPADRARPAVQDYTGDDIQLTLDERLADGLRSVAQRHGVTLYMVILAGWAALLSRLSGQEDVVIGTPVANRTRREIEGLIGFFVNTLAIRVDVSGSPSTRELLQRVKQQMLKAQTHADIPFDQVVELVKPERTLSHSPIFQVMLGWQNMPEAFQAELPGLEVQPLGVSTGATQFELLLMLRGVDGRIAGVLTYATALFERETVERYLGYWRRLLEGMVADEQRPVDQLEWMADAEREQVLVQWNATEAEYPADKCTHELFEEQVRRTPDAAAVVHEAQELTYGQLNERANRLAHYLRDQGVGPDERVGICVERGIPMVVGLLGILKAGGAYVPLDPSYPAQRLKYMLADSEPVLLLADEAGRAALSGQELPVPVIDLPGDGKGWSRCSSRNPSVTAVGLRSDHLAYVIYTSGSTGEPKGVMVEHRNVVNYVLGIASRIKFVAGMKHAYVSTVSADLGNTVVFGALTTGGCLHVLSYERSMSASAFSDYLSLNDIDVLKITPSHLATLQQAERLEALLPRQRLILGGESSLLEWAKTMRALKPTCMMHNHYGPTETTIGALTYSLGSKAPCSQSLPLGKPLPNMHVYILDRQRRPVPIGVVGEIYIGGAGVARGYLNDPDLTADRFSADPFSVDPGRRLYRSGDLGRYLPGGDIEFLGRVDDQVKIRGFRVQLEEVEATLRSCPGVKAAAVSVREEKGAGAQIVGYVVPSNVSEIALAGCPVYELPNDLPVAHLNRHETKYLFREIFELQAYVRHGITIRDGSWVVDAGANIGLFTLFAHCAAQNVRVLSVEPNPLAYEVLTRNLQAYEIGGKCIHCGLGMESGEAQMTLFEGMSLLSGFHANADSEKDVVKRFLKNQMHQGVLEEGSTAHVEELLTERFRAQKLRVPTRTLSSVIEEERIEQIDLLKINVEKSELRVLRGIRDDDWKRIRQIVLEVDVLEHREPILSLLKEHGYEVVTEQDSLLRGTALCYVYAIRPENAGKLIPGKVGQLDLRELPRPLAGWLTPQRLRQYMKERLPEYMVPAAYVRLESLPLTTNGKLDRKRLAAPEGEAYSHREYEAPRGELEETLAQLWRDLLKIDRVGRHDNFFDLGGHSLRAVQLISRIAKGLSLRVSVQQIFQHPTLQGLAEALGTVKWQEVPPIGVADRGGMLELSLAQQRLWLITQLDARASRAYHIPLAVRLRGALDRRALRAALDRIVARHESLRTRFEVVDGQAVQRIDPPQVGFALEERAVPEGPEGVERLKEWMEEEAGSPFDLSVGPLIRGQLIGVGDEEHVLQLTMHHIVSDGWSIGVLAKELWRLYGAYRAGQEDPLPQLPLQYADYAQWQRQWLAGQRLQEQGRYWQSTLSGAPQQLSLPSDRARPTMQDYAGAVETVELDEGLTGALKGLSRRCGTTLYMTVLAGWAALLSRLSGQSEVVIGTPTANRTCTEIEGLIGFFVNTLAIRVDVSGSPSTVQLLERVKRQSLDAQAHQDIPFEQVVELVKPERTLSHSPIFQVMLAWQNMPEAFHTELPGVEVQPLGVSTGTTQFDLSLMLREVDGRILGGVTYATALFERETVERYLGYWRRLLEGMVADEQRPVDQLEWMADAERERVLVQWNATEAEYAADKCIHELFEEQVDKTPEAVAVQYEDRTLSYAELNSRANRLAHYLRDQGVGPDTRVGICVERSLEMVVGLLGILKAGGAYVPLDPGYPAQRLKYMLTDSEPVLLLADEVGRAALSGQELSVPVVDLKQDAGRWSHRSSRNPSVSTVGLRSEHLAYVIYTSGSTGEPKGVMVEHAGVANFLMGMQQGPGLQGTDCLLSVTTVSFDIAALELYWPLINGAKLVLASRQEVADARRLSWMLEEYGVTVMQGTPATWRLLLSGGWKGREGLKALCGGEALNGELAGKLLGRVGLLWNLYGPTETTIWSCARRVGAVSERGAVECIGRPIANTQIYILDGWRRPVPIGVEGEIYIGGAGVARGYLNRPELTAERFLDSPFVPGDRVYKTGDRGRWRVDGNIEFLGRNDHQVKIRGYRIELGEIEARLLGHPGVKEAVVVAREDEPGQKRLVAYYTPGGEWEGESDEGIAGARIEQLRTHLRELLPEYMVPAVYVRLESLPLTTNGKLDRKRLAAPEGEAYSHREYEAPRGELEETLAQLWRDLLKIDRVGRHDNFFDLGGHSLRAVQLISRIAKGLSLRVSVQQIFQHPTLQGLAEALGTVKWQEVPPIGVADRGGMLELSLAQQRLWFLAQLDARASRAYHIPLAARLRGALDRRALRAALDRIVARHESLRTRFEVVDGQAVQRIDPPQVGFALEERAVPEGPEGVERLKEWMEEEAGSPFDLSVGPLIRGQLIGVGDEEHVLQLTMHHIVSDGWSIGVLIRELWRLYGAYRAGQEDPLPQLPLQYADYAQWQRQWLAGQRLQEQGRYWQSTLSGAPQQLSLPSDRARPTMQDYAGAVETVELDEGLTGALKGLSRRCGTTLYMTVLAGWAALLSRLSGQSEVVIGTPTANRTCTEIEGLIGFFVNTLAIRVDVSGSPSTVQLLERVKRQSLDAQAHQDIPFEQVVELVKPERTLSHSPIFQVMLVWQNVPRLREGELPQLRIERITPPMQTSQFDLSLSLWERDGRIVGEVVYANALFEAQTIRRYLSYWKMLLQGMVGDEARAVEELEILPVDERALVVDEWNRTEVEYPAERCIHELFEEQVDKTPEAVAVQYEDQSLSYGELNARANRLADYLKGRGVGPGEFVVLRQRRSAELILSELAVLKCGAAYVPIDLDWPRQRQQLVVKDCQSGWVLCDAGMPDWPDMRVTWINVDEVLSSVQPADPTCDRRSIKVPGEADAYVMYTSGSTGEPKGVVIPHRAISRLVINSGYVRIDPTDCVAHCSNPAFDASTFEVWGALLNGARVLIVPRSIALDDKRFSQMMSNHDVTVLFQTTALFNQRATAASKIFGRLRYVLFGGELSDTNVVRGALQSAPPKHLLHVYGPTESTTFTTWYPTVSVPAGANSIPIGRPIANTRIYILDRRRRPVPIGVEGEIYIGGAGVARGYLNRPELTAERFLDSPFVPGDRVYKTGDRGRWRVDGNIEFLGRNDRQVKIRGYRIELGEIEARLLGHPGVKEAVVVAREDEPGQKRLVAYYTPGGEWEGESDEGIAGARIEQLRTHLRELLPEYMVPAVYVRLESLPLTTNGKLDRKRLAAPEGEAYSHREYEAPRGELEETLAQLWRDLLKIDRVGRHDNFFDLGGHSLRAVQLISRIAKGLSLRVSVQQIFQHPTLQGLAEALGTVKWQEVPPIGVADRGGMLELSLAQQRLWLITQLDARASRAYHIPLAVRLRGALDRRALRAALDRIVARHESLRTRFEVVDGQAVQRIDPPQVGFALEERAVPEGPEGVERLKEWMEEEAGSPFDLSVGPLIRGQLIGVGDEEHVLQLTMHHIVSDGWSIGVLAKELWRLYGAYRAGQEDPLPQLPLQYADYAQWQRQWLAGQRLQEQGRYWQSTLSGAPQQLSLPSDRARPTMQDYAGAVETVELDEGLTGALKGLSRRCGTTLYMTVLAGWAALLSRLSGQSEVVIGTPTANRTCTEIEGLIGFFVNTLAIRVDVSGSPSTVQLLERVKRQSLDAQAHQDIPFEQVVELVKPERTLSHSPIFQVMLAWQNMPEAFHAELPGVEVQPLGVSTGTTQFDLSLMLREVDGRILGGVTYATALFERETVERYLGYWRRLLEGMVADEQRPVDQLEWMADAERERVLVQWNATEAEYAADKCIHELFEEQVDKTPEAVAVQYEDRTLSYAELNSRANRLAHYLRDQGVGPDTRVGICVERSLEMVVGLLGILKAGGAYVPLDPGYPAQRLKYMLTDSEPVLLLADEVGRAALSGQELSVPVVDLKQDAGRWSHRSSRNPSVSTVGLRSEHLAYVIYTSGSTGEPKGVMVEHRNVVRLFAATAERFGFGPQDVWTLFHSVAFDFSVWEMWGALLHGGRLVVVSLEMSRSPEDFNELVCREGVSVLNQTPSAFMQFQAVQVRSSRKHALRRVIFGGEALEVAALKPWYERHAEQHPLLVNMYGITETTVHVTYRALRAEDAQHYRAASPIGSRLGDLRLYILDGHRRPVPIGVAGEIYIGGAGVARGYLNRRELTAERFLPDPFAGVADARMYRTGDLGRWRADGNIEFVGRNDAQVKIRGYRIELGEIEARLLGHPGVKEAVVVAREDEPGQKRLVAYYTAGGEWERESDEAVVGERIEQLRTYLREQLPEYMVPTSYVQLESLPLTANGKLDRKRLPAPDAGTYSRRKYEAPQGEMEETLAQLWRELLKLDRVGRHDNFFELGGHSLLAVTLIERMRQQRLRTDARTVFVTGSFREFALKVVRIKEIVL